MPSVTQRRVKIVCTLGPSSRSPEQIGRLIDEGMDVARLNFSHGDHAFHAELIASIRTASLARGRPVAIMQDLQGPKIRLGKLPAAGVTLQAGDRVLLYPEGAQPSLGEDSGWVLLPISAEIAGAVATDTQKGARILFDDGKVMTRVTHVASPEIRVEVEVGGKLTSHKGMNLPGTPLSIPCVTAKDLEDLEFGLAQGVDAVALSFVRTAADIETVRERIRNRPSPPALTPLLVAKIEREEAIENIDSILEVIDALLVARGDMAVELGAERVPTIQKKLISACNELGVPVITATQMLESMIGSPTPTRAEASDVANAVFDGTDAVMLSAETASGAYPFEAVRVMSRIILEAERSQDLSRVSRDLIPLPGSVVESVEFSASRIAQHVGAVAIGCLTHSGVAARALAKFRPDTPIVAIVDNEAILRRLCLTWGVRGVRIERLAGTDDVFGMVEQVLIREGWAQPRDLIVVTAGVPTLKRGTTNTIKVHRVGVASERPRP